MKVLNVHLILSFCEDVDVEFNIMFVCLLEQVHPNVERRGPRGGNQCDFEGSGFKLHMKEVLSYCDNVLDFRTSILTCKFMLDSSGGILFASQFFNFRGVYIHR